VRSERDAQIGTPMPSTALIAAVLAALACLFASSRAASHWELQGLRNYLRADREFTRLRTVDTGILMVQQLKDVVARKAAALRAPSCCSLPPWR